MNWIKYKFIYFLFSLALIGVGVFGLVELGLPLGLDFVGGSVLEVKSDVEITGKDVDGVVQKTGEGNYMIKTKEEIGKEETLLKLHEIAPNAEELRFESVGPSIGPELIKKTIYAVSIAAGMILVWVAFQFKSFKFGIAAILAMLHDSFILVGSFTLFGAYFGAKVDFLFVTALLTTLSFSVHDTIVVFDRIREISSNSVKVAGYKDDITTISNKAISETMVRSLNNSFTIIFMLVALVLLGGITVRWFAVALLIGTILGTYSSPFVAIPLLVVFDKLRPKDWIRNLGK